MDIDLEISDSEKTLRSVLDDFPQALRLTIEGIHPTKFTASRLVNDQVLIIISSDSGSLQYLAPSTTLVGEIFKQYTFFSNLFSAPLSAVTFMAVLG